MNGRIPGQPHSRPLSAPAEPDVSDIRTLRVLVDSERARSRVARDHPAIAIETTEQIGPGPHRDVVAVTEGVRLATLACNAGLPTVRITDDSGRDAEMIAWTIDCPEHLPHTVVDERVRIAERRAAEVAAHRAARSASRPMKLLHRVLRHRAGVPLPPAGAATGMIPAVAERVTPIDAEPRVSVIVPHRDQPELLAQLLHGIASTRWQNLELVIVDNGTTDDTALRLLRGADAIVATMPIDFNFARLCNRGADISRGTVLVFLNNDIELGDPDWLAPLVAAVRSPGTGPVGCCLTFPDGTLQHGGIAIGPNGPFHPFAGTPPGAAADIAPNGQRTAVTGACLAIRRSAFWAIGGFDPLFHHDYNDVDLCLRARACGYAVQYLAHPTLIHHESATRGTDVNPETVGDWYVMRARWSGVLDEPEQWWPPPTAEASLAPSRPPSD